MEPGPSPKNPKKNAPLRDINIIKSNFYGNVNPQNTVGLQAYDTSPGGEGPLTG
jgi:hypothetical protein